MQKQKVIGIAVSVVLAAVGTALLVGYVRSAEHKASSADRTASVLVVTDTIAKGTKADDIAGKVRDAKVPANVVASGALSSLAPVAGKVTLAELLPGEQVVAGRFASPAEAGTAAAPPGMLQLAVKIDQTRAVAGQIREGDSVAVMASFDEPETTRMIEQKVLVTGVRNGTGALVKDSVAGQVPSGDFQVILALAAPSVERVVFAAEHGRLWLAWEPKDADGNGTGTQTKATVNL